MPTYGLLDLQSVGILYLVKLYRIGSLWITLYVLDKVYQEKYVERVYASHKSAPNLRTMPLYAAALQCLFFLICFVIVLLLERRFKKPGNTYVIDDVLLMQIMCDFVITLIVFTAGGYALAYIISDCSILRYNHDGLRGIRALSRLLYYYGTLVYLVPCFLVY